ncbi:MAG: hypothetical protein Q9N68_13810 [Gammaproteobacteria bacterium]|nr:hypothetical protein [Gammaproteobacteria bacterium]
MQARDPIDNGSKNEHFERILGGYCCDYETYVGIFAAIAHFTQLAVVICRSAGGKFSS